MSQLLKSNFLGALQKLSEYLPSEQQTSNAKYLNAHTTNELLLNFFEISKQDCQFSEEEKQALSKLVPTSLNNIHAGISYSFTDLTAEKLITAQSLRSGLQFFVDQFKDCKLLKSKEPSSSNKIESLLKLEEVADLTSSIVYWKENSCDSLASCENPPDLAGVPLTHNWW